MIHRKVFDIFKEYLPNYANCVNEWFPNGKNSVRLRMCTHEDYVFTFYGPDHWCFETVTHFITRLAEERKGQ